jgi:membrane protein YqaA with SNARE-associated domain
MVSAIMQYQQFKTFFCSRLAIVIACVWGFSEATFFFVIPDVFFMLTAIFSPRRAFVHVFATVLGALAGGSLMYFLAWEYPQQMIRFLYAIPLISQKLIVLVHEKLIHDGLNSIFIAPFQGIPYKLYAVQSAIVKIDFLQFLIISIPARLVRMLLLTAIVSLVAFCFGDSIKKTPKYG